MNNNHKIKEMLASLAHFSEAEKAVFYACYLAADDQAKTKIESFLMSQKTRLASLNDKLKNQLDSALQKYLDKVQNTVKSQPSSQTPAQLA